MFYKDRNKTANPFFKVLINQDMRMSAASTLKRPAVAVWFSVVFTNSEDRVAAASAHCGGSGGGMRKPSALVGGTVVRTAFDYQTRLSLIARDGDEGYRLDAELVIETPFLLRDSAGQWHELNPGAGVALAPVLDLFAKTVTQLQISERGALTLDFDDGAQLFVGPDIRYESWSLSGTGVEPHHHRPRRRN